VSTRSACEQRLEIGPAFRRLVRLLAVRDTAEEEVVHPFVRREPDRVTTPAGHRPDPRRAGRPPARRR
jgi:hypothetical protein